MEAECNFEKRIEIQSIRDHTCWIQKENKMNVENLAMVMGPTILGNSSNEPMAVMSEVSTLNNHPRVPFKFARAFQRCVILLRFLILI